MENNIDSLSMLIKDTAGKSDSRILRYVPSKSIATKILSDFGKLYDKDAKSFPLTLINGKSDGRYGVITDIMSLSTYLELQSLDTQIEGEDAGIFYGLISNIFASVYRGESPIFDASPYTGKDDITTYVETASKIIPTMVDLRDDLILRLFRNKNYVLDYEIEYPANLLIKVNRPEGGAQFKSKDARLLLVCVEQLIIDSIRMLNDAALMNGIGTEDYIIDGKKVDRAGISSSKIKYRGWSFKKPLKDRDSEYDTSLFYTYMATNAFISLYNSMEKFYDALDNGIDPYKGLNSDYLPPKEKAVYNKYVEDKHFYERNSAVLADFRYATACAGRYIDSVLRKKGINISFTYVDKNLNAVSMADILSGNNNHIMNSLFVYAILTNAGIDDDYNSIGKSSMYQTIQFALNNIKKIYLEFKDQEREDLIDSYSMGDERCPNEERKIVQNWRKIGLPSPYDLVPLYFNTYYLVSEYIINYPQKEMRENLVWVMENKDDEHWYWTKNGFNLNNNLYYILSLDLFYMYYAEYEQPMLEKYNAKSTAEKYEAEIARLNVEHNKELSRMERQYEEWRNTELEQVKHTASPLDEQLKSFVYDITEQIWQEKFNKSMKCFVDDALAHCLSIAVVDEDKKDELYGQLKNDEQFVSAVLLAALEKTQTYVSENIKYVSDDVQMEQFKKEILDKLFNSMFKS